LPPYRAPAAWISSAYPTSPHRANPAPGEIRVRVHASSLNFHDYSVVSGVIPTEDGRIPMSDGAGVV